VGFSHNQKDFIMGDCISPAALSEIASKDTSRLVGSIAKTLAANSPFLNVLSGGVFQSNISDEQRTVVQQQAAPGDSLAVPTFVCDTEICGQVGQQDLTGTTEFTIRLESKRGFGPRICVKKGYSSFKGSYLMAEDSLRKLITQYINSDIRAQLYLRSASKFNAVAGFDFNSLFTGGSETDVGVLFAGAGALLPTGQITFKAVHAIARYLKDALFADMFPASGKAQMHFRFIGSSDIIESFRAEIGVENVLCCLTQGSFKLGEVALSAFSFESSPAYRGIAFATDQRPLRATGFNPDGTLALVDPVVVITDACKNRAYAKANPAWLDAEYEVAFLVAENSFKRLVPEKYIGEGSFRFSPQLHMGELEWFYQRDNDCNVFGDFGHHIYQITRAYQPLRPQHIVPILYKRCKTDLGLVACDDSDLSSFSGADSSVAVGCVLTQPECL
jgi:hypothetical protein